MCESSRNGSSLDSRLSFYEYPPHKSSINSKYPLRKPTNNLPESNRDELLVSLQSLSLKIKAIENERKKAELNFRDIIDEIIQSSSTRRNPPTNIDEKSRDNFLRTQTSNVQSSSKRRTSRKHKRICQHNHCSSSTPTIINIEGKHYHSDLNDILPFILGRSISQSHNVKSNLQNVIALLKNHNHQLCSSTKKHADLLHPRRKSQLSLDTLFYLDHCDKPSSRRSQTVSTTDSQCHSCTKYSETSSSDIESLNQRMETLSEELEHLQRQFMMSSHDHLEQEPNKISFETLGSTKLLQLILKDEIND